MRLAPNAPIVHAKPHHAGARTATRLRARLRRRARFHLARLRRIARSRTRRRRALVWLGVILAALATPLFATYLLSRATPTWWTRVELASTQPPVDLGSVPADWPARAAEVENAVVAQLSLVRPGRWHEDGVWRSEPWSVSITEEDASAWLATRLPRWVKNREGESAWPMQVAQARVSFTQGRIIAGAMLRNGGAVQIMGVEVHPWVDPQGALRVPAKKVRIGRVALPAAWLFGAITSRADDFIPRESLESPTAQTVSDALRGESVLTRNAVIRLEDGRRVRVLNLSPHDGRMDLTFQTERR